MFSYQSMSKSTHSEQWVTLSPILGILLVVLAHVNTGLKVDKDFAAGYSTGWSLSEMLI